MSVTDPSNFDTASGRQDGGDAIGRAVMIGFVAYLAISALICWGVFKFLPNQIAFTLVHHHFSIGELHRRILSTALVMGLVIPTIFVIELALVGWRESSLRLLIVEHTPSSMSDLACFLGWQARIMSVLTFVMSLGVALISGAWLHDRIHQYTGINLTLAGWPVVIQAVVFFVVYSFFDYWAHRTDHSRYFWPLHRFHHAADDFCVLNSVRTHPAVFTDIIAITMPAALFEASPDAIIAINLFTLVLRYVIHSRIDSNWGWFGRYVLQSPVHHRLHHILDMTVPVGHYALTPIWDHMFGTWRGDATQSLVIGVAAPYRHGAWIGPDLWRDYVDFWRGWTHFGRPQPLERGVAVERARAEQDQNGQACAG